MIDENIRLLSGNEAIAQGAWEAGILCACSYPGTPATEILDSLKKYSEIDSQWSINEKSAFEIAYGAAIGGLRALYSSKHVGLNAAMDPIMTSAYTGINAGLVIVSADDPGIHSSQNEQDNRYIAKIANLPLIQPAGPEEAKEYIKIAYDISEQFDIPVLFRITTRISHSKENVKINSRTEVKNKKYIKKIDKYLMIPKFAIQRHTDLKKRMKILKNYSERTELNKIEMNDPEIGFVTDSICYYYVKEKYPDASILKLGLTYPFPDDKIIEFSKKVNNLFVIEELEPFIEEHIKFLGINVIGKHESFITGELKPEYIPFIVNQGKKPLEKKFISTKPALCEGCPHGSVFSVLKDYDVVISGDIGCYTLGALSPYSSMDGNLCMGASITIMQGLEKAVSKKVVSVIGDSTFYHSGITGLINAVSNYSKGIVIILDNSVTAMTGGQPYPGTEKIIGKHDTKRIFIEDICKACGVKNIDVISSFKVKEIRNLFNKRIQQDELSVIITRAPCLLAVKKLKS